MENIKENVECGIICIKFVFDGEEEIIGYRMEWQSH